MRHKGDLAQLGSIEEIKAKQGMRMGAVFCLNAIAEKVGLAKALGRQRQGRLALWQVLARFIDQGSRLSAVRLAESHAACDLLGLDAFNEDHLYSNLSWLSEHQEAIEKRLFRQRYGGATPQLFLYDVTSSYLEGVQSVLAAFGYDRDGKRGKMQLVIGLLTGPEGTPVAVRVFAGNTPDTQTVAEQVRILADSFGVENVTVARNREDKLNKIERLLKEKNLYLAEHSGAKVEVAQREVGEKAKQLKIDEWVKVVTQGRTLELVVEEEVKKQAAELDGCYVIKTDLSAEVATAETIHDRYKDLAQVELAFRTFKSGHLKVRPTFARTEASTRGHVFMVMLAYLLERELDKYWRHLEVTVAEGIDELGSLRGVEITMGQATCQKVPELAGLSKQLLDAADIKLPAVLPLRKVHVATRKKLVSERHLN